MPDIPKTKNTSISEYKHDNGRIYKLYVDKSGKKYFNIIINKVKQRMYPKFKTVQTGGISIVDNRIAIDSLIEKLHFRRKKFIAEKNSLDDYIKISNNHPSAKLHQLYIAKIKTHDSTLKEFYDCYNSVIAELTSLAPKINPISKFLLQRRISEIMKDLQNIQYINKKLDA